MKLIKQSKLFFREGNSDKVYEIDLCQLSETEYLVNFRYGRRGANLKEGTKTSEAVSAEKAESIFSALENEKRKKGYQSEAETFSELPQISIDKPTSQKETIMLRLQDAVEKKDSFKSKWRTSRVIWKAAELDMHEAVPFVLRLASRGDDLQLYASLWTLIKFGTKEAEPLFKSYALSTKQKAYIRNIAFEGWISITDDDEAIKEITTLLMEKLPFDVKYDIETNNLEALEVDLKVHSKNGNVRYFSDLYLLTRVQRQLLPILQTVISTWELKPPYFKYIRSIYKLAQIRKDYKTLAQLSYRFEREKQMFNRTKSLDSSSRQYIGIFDKVVNVGKELKQADSNLAFSQFTKAYFQRNSLNTLISAGKSGNAEEYLRLAVSLLLQYHENDYRKAEERPLEEYGRYHYSDRKYYFTVGIFPECFDSLLLTNILYGNDAKRILQKNLTYIIDKYTVKSDRYYYDPRDVVRTDGHRNSLPIQSKNESGLSSAIKFVKGLFGKKEVSPTPEPQPIEDPVINEPTHTADSKLYPELWDAMPQAYIQLLIQAKMNLIHQFAYDNLKNRTDLDQLIARLDTESIIHLLTSDFEIPAQFGYEALLQKEQEFISDPEKVVLVLNSNNESAIEWAKKQILQNISTYFYNLNFTVALIQSSKDSIKTWIDDLLKQTPLTEDRIQASIGKLVIDMIQWKNTDENNKNAHIVANRIMIVAQNHLQNISWKVIEQLVLSPLESNILLASHITVQKVSDKTISEIPFSLIQLYLQSNIIEVRQNGIRLLNLYTTNYFETNTSLLYGIISENPYKDIVEKAISIISQVIDSKPSAGNAAIERIVYSLVRKETFEGAHTLIITFVKEKLKPFWNSGLSPRNLTKLLFSQYRDCQLLGYEILRNYAQSSQFTISQIVALASHDLLAVRQWSWRYYKENLARIKYEKDKSLGILDSKWDDTREFAFHYFSSQFEEQDWDPDTLISITDSIRNDVENFGRELITKYFDDRNGLEYLTKLSQHPSMNIQSLVTNYLTKYAGGKPDVVAGLEYYFRSILTRVNKARVAKNRIFRFLEAEALSSVESATIILPILDNISAQSTVQDKSTCIHILTRIKRTYPHLDMHLSIKN